MDNERTEEEQEELCRTDKKDNPWRMPWLHLIDSNGELPSNYKEILAMEEKVASERKKPKSAQKTENDQKQWVSWLHLLDRKTGELPKNYKQILAKEQQQKLDLGQNREENELQSTTLGNIVQNFDNSFKQIQSENKQKTFKVPKKSLTTNTSNLSLKTVGAKRAPKPSSMISTKSSTVSTKKSTKNIKKVEFIPQIKVSSPQQSGNHFRRQLFASTPGTQQISPKTPSPLGESIIVQSDAVSSTEKFVQLENLLQTPKTNKIDSLQKLEAYIKETEGLIRRQTEALEELKQFYNYIKSEKLENISKMPINESNKKKSNLRTDVLKKTVSFVNGKENLSSALNRYNNLKKANAGILQTPKSEKMRTILSQKVMNQCLMLEDTPRK